MNKSVIKYILGISCVYMTVTGCSSPKADDAKTQQKKEAENNTITLTQTQIRNAGIETGNPDQTNLSEVIKANGVVDVPPMNLASVSVPISGYVKSTTMLPGSPVRQGEVLANIYSMDYIQMQQDYLQAISRLKFLTQELDRQTVLNQEDVGARKKLQQAESEVSSVQAQTKALQIKLQLLGCNIDNLRKNNISSTINVVSPISGYVKLSTLSIGKNVMPTDVLFEIVGTAHKHLEVKVFEKDITKIRKGQKVLLINPVISSQPVWGEIILVGKTVEPETKSINLHVHILDEEMEARLTVGQFVNVKILCGTRTALTLPEDAVVRQGTDGQIFIEEKANTFKPVLVKLGETEKGNIEIISNEKLESVKIVRKGASIIEAMHSGEEN
ncbi:efflux RND transporter periplasmic adaptor subunit [Pseudarcicella hirudinis]|nr:efflux RND transporter periplasmic adaptor subunit [Pseudarcicella hirudinis]